MLRHAYATVAGFATARIHKTMAANADTAIARSVLPTDTVNFEPGSHDENTAR